MNTHHYPFDQVAKMIRGQLLQKNTSCITEHLLIDSRKLSHPETTLFFAIKGQRRDGHDYMDELYAKGVRQFVVSKELDITKYPDAAILRVKDTIHALQNLTAQHRKKFNLPVIGITGSNGKTIVKEWLYQLLQHDYNIVRSPKSYNSQIGVPLSVWELSSYHNLAVFEAGISQPNEMADLEKVIQPTIGIFTNIGKAHDEGFLNIRQKINEKLKLFIKAELLIYCKDYVYINECIGSFIDRMKSADSNYVGYQTFTWSRLGHKDADVIIQNILKHQAHAEIEAIWKNKSFLFSIPFTDDASIENAINCWMLMLHLGIDANLASSRLMSLNKVEMRLELKDGINQCTLINDYYNSDLHSLRIALDFLRQQKQSVHKTVILSDMLQTGMADVALYGEIAEIIAKSGVQRLIGIGNAISRQQKQFKARKELQVAFYKNTGEFLSELSRLKFQDEIILLKGARAYEFEKIAKQLEHKHHETLLEINLTALTDNLRMIQSHLKPETKTMVMVKAFSYGSGSFEIANVLQTQRVEYLGVAYADEGVHLRKAGIHTPIMVMNPEEGTYDQVVLFKLEPVLYNLRSLKNFIPTIQSRKEELTEPYPVHLEIETGMHRLGFDESDLIMLIDLLRSNKKYIRVQSVFSHLAASDNPNFDDYTYAQIEQFKKVSASIEQALGYSFLQHICNTAGIIRFPEAQFDMVRLGIGLYGVDGSGLWQNQLRNVSTLKTIVSQLKYLKAGDTVGYDRKGKTNRDTVVATIGIGYADGLHRNLSNGVGKMWIRDMEVPIIGNICMDMCMLDVTEVKDVEEGDEVIVFGEAQSPVKLANQSGTIPYEIISSISQRVKRVYYRE